MLTIKDKTRIKVTSSLVASVAPAIKKEQSQIKTVTELNNTVQRPLQPVPVGPAPRPVQEAQMAKVGIPAWRTV